jgi:hypothetical protein
VAWSIETGIRRGIVATLQVRVDVLAPASTTASGSPRRAALA